MGVLLEKQYIVIGAGNIGRILLKHLRAAGIPADHLMVCDVDSSRASAAAEQFGVRVVSLEDDRVSQADTLLIAVSPKNVIEVLLAIANHLRPGQIVISFAAANPLTWLETLVPNGVSVIRIMPNGPAYIQQGMNPVVYGQSVTPEARAFVEALLPLLGKSIEVRDDQMTWCVGLAGAGLRTILPVLEGMTTAGIEAGFSAGDARRIAAQVMLGTAALALETDLSFEEIRALTPMQTLDETAVAQLFYDTACTTKEKVDGMQAKLREA